MKNVERLLLRPAEAAELLGISRSRMYELLRNDEVPSIVLGRARSKRIPLDRLKIWIDENLNGTAAAHDEREVR
jgi:excisionase family DNA binding protein